MPILKLYQYWEVDISGVKSRGGSISTPVQIDIDGEKLDLTNSLANDSTWNVWTAGDVMSDFDFLWVEADQDVQLELTVDYGAEVGTILIPLVVTAGTPLALSYDDAIALHTANFATGSEDVIDRIRVRNESGSTAKVRVVLFT